MRKISCAGVGAVVLAIVAAPLTARADDANNASPPANVCKDSYENAQSLMQPNQAESKLMPAREMLRTCMRSGCKDWMVADCSKWLSEVEARIPTVVFSAKNTVGRDLTDISVTRESGEVLTTRLDGRIVEMEPGQQVFVFVAPDGVRREKRVLVREGEKAQSIAATFDASGEEIAASRGPSGSDVAMGAAPRVGHESRPSSLTYVGYGMAGVGTIGLAIGTIFGITAISKKNEANCDATNACDPGPLDAARSAATVATIGVVAGAALLAGGVALVMLAPSASSSHARARTLQRLDARVSVGAFGLSGSWQ